MTGAGLSAGQAAQRLGVAVTTLRSWHRRYGLGPTQHVAGHHRRYSDYDLSRLETMRILTSQGVPAARAARLAINGRLPAQWRTTATAPPPAERSWLVRGLVQAGLRLDAVAVREQVAAVIRDHGVVPAWEQLIRPVLAAVEARQAGRPGQFGSLVAAEHLLSGCASEALAAVERPAGPPRVLLACADEEQHSLPLEALAAALAERSLGHRLLGARVPAAALRAAVQRTGPALVVVWSQVAATADPAQLTALLAVRPRPAVVAAAGPGWGQLPPGVTKLVSLPAAVELATTVVAAG